MKRLLFVVLMMSLSLIGCGGGGSSAPTSSSVLTVNKTFTAPKAGTLYQTKTITPSLNKVSVSRSVLKSSQTVKNAVATFAAAGEQKTVELENVSSSTIEFEDNQGTVYYLGTLNQVPAQSIITMAMSWNPVFEKNGKDLKEFLNWSGENILNMDPVNILADTKPDSQAYLMQEMTKTACSFSVENSVNLISTNIVDMNSKLEWQNLYSSCGNQNAETMADITTSVIAFSNSQTDKYQVWGFEEKVIEYALTDIQTLRTSTDSITIERIHTNLTHLTYWNKHENIRQPMNLTWDAENQEIDFTLFPEDGGITFENGGGRVIGYFNGIEIMSTKAFASISVLNGDQVVEQDFNTWTPDYTTQKPDFVTFVIYQENADSSIDFDKPVARILAYVN
jgi:hypothetical protein